MNNITYLTSVICVVFLTTGCGPGPKKRQTFAPPELNETKTSKSIDFAHPSTTDNKTNPTALSSSSENETEPKLTTISDESSVKQLEEDSFSHGETHSANVISEEQYSFTPEEHSKAELKQNQQPPLETNSATAKEIVKKSDDLMRGDSNRGTYEMTIHTPQWERTLKILVYSLGRDKIFIRVLSPAKESGIGTLRIDNEMWNYLPSVEKIIKIPPSMMLQPWMGSDFANDDLVKESSIVNDYTHSILSQETISGYNAYKIELLPKEDAPVIWGKMIRWIRTEDFVPLKEEYYNEHNDLIKVLDYSDIAQMSDRIIPTTWTMTAKTKEGHYTIIRLLDVAYNVPINNFIFSLTHLKRVQ